MKSTIGLALLGVAAASCIALPEPAPAREARRATASAPCNATPPADASVPEANARAHVQAGELKNARSELERCLAIDGRRPGCLMGLADVALRERKDGEALALFTRAALATPTVARPYLALADTYLRLSRPAEAEQVLNEAKRLTPKLGEGRFEIFALNAQTFLDRNDVRGAIAELESARSQLASDAPEQLELMYSLGSLYATSEPPRKAEALDSLRTFHARACKGAAAAKRATECEVARQLISQLGGTLQ